MIGTGKAAMTTPLRPLRFGLAGTGHWARITHAPALASTGGIEFASVWGRNRAAAGSLAAEYGATAFSDLDAFLSGVDAVAFSVPPDVQSALAVRAARAGKHLLLEKPIATTEAAADALARAVADSGVASVVFFTARFQAEVRAWLAGVASQDGWAGGGATWLGSALQDTNPFNTPWRRDKGGLWDLGPHAVSLLWAWPRPSGLRHRQRRPGGRHPPGPAPPGRGHQHGDGHAERARCRRRLRPVPLGRAGPVGRPRGNGDARRALRVALTELAGNARSGQVSHSCDVRFGRDVGHVLAEAQRQVDARRAS